METLPDAEWPSLTEVTFQATERLDPLEGILLEATTRDEAQSDNRAKEVNDLIRRAGEEKAHGDALIGTHPPTQGEWEKTQPSYKRADELWTAALALREKADKSRPGRHADYITGLVTALRNGHAYARALLAQHVVLLLRSPRWTVEGTRPGLAIREVILKDWLENPFTVEFAQGVSVEYAGVAYCGVIVRRPTGAETGEASPGGNAPPEPNDEVPPVELATLSKRLGGRPPNPARDRIVASYFERRDAGYQPPDPNVRGSMAKEIDAILEGIGCMNVDAKETTVRTSVIARGDRTSRPLPLSGRERGSETCRRPAVDEHRLIAEYPSGNKIACWREITRQDVPEDQVLRETGRTPGDPVCTSRQP
jgi:hypothetical protein